MCPRQRKTSSITSHSTVWSNSRQFGRMQLVKTDGETEMKNRLRLRFLPLWRFEKEEAIQLECFLNTITEDYSQTEPRHAFHLRDTLNCCSLHVYKEYLKVGLLKGLFLTFNVVFIYFWVISSLSPFNKDAKNWEKVLFILQPPLAFDTSSCRTFVTWRDPVC